MDQNSVYHGNASRSSTNEMTSESEKKRKRSERSMVWYHFTKLIDGLRCKCDYCGRDYACSSANGTSSLRKHLESCFKYKTSVEQDEKQKVLCSEKKDRDGDPMVMAKSVAFDKEACRKSLTHMIIVDELPFSFVEKEGFQRFSKQLEPRFDLPCRITIARDVYKLYLCEKQKLKKYFISSKQRVCITTDTWTSAQNCNYMVVTAHYIDSNWNLQKRILNFCMITDHKGDTIGKLIESCLLEWGIERLFTITVDNASANDVTVNFVKTRLKTWDEYGVVLDGEFLHMRCCAHIVNLIVTEGLKEMHDSILKIRQSVKFIRSSTSRQEKLKKYAESEKIDSKSLCSLDVQTRWNSTYLMLESTLKFRKAFDRLWEEDGHHSFFLRELDNDGNNLRPPSDDDWENANAFVMFLRTFYDITLKFSGSLHVTSNLYFHEMCSIHSDLRTLIASEDSLLAKMAIGMKHKYDKYWGSIENMNKLLIISVVIDPRYKLPYVKFCFEDMFGVANVEEMIREIKHILLRLYDYYVKLDSSLGDGGVQASNFRQQFNDVDVRRKMLDKRDSSSSSKLTSIAKFRIQRVQNENIDMKNEVERYLLEPCEDFDDDDEFDILIWWKTNSAKYRILSQISKDVFPIPISTVASESAFSTGGRILDSFRSSLSPKMVETLICCQNWLRSHASLDEPMTADEMNLHDAIISEVGSSVAMATEHMAFN